MVDLGYGEPKPSTDGHVALAIKDHAYFVARAKIIKFLLSLGRVMNHAKLVLLTLTTNLTKNNIDYCCGS